MASITTGGTFPENGLIVDRSETTLIPQTGDLLFSFVVDHKDAAMWEVGDKYDEKEIVNISVYRRGFMYRYQLSCINRLTNFTEKRLVVFTFPGRAPTALRLQTPQRYITQPFTASVMATVEVSFIKATDAGSINPPKPDIPTYDGEQVDFYGGVYSGVFRIGLTDPPTPPSRFLDNPQLMEIPGVPTWRRYELTKVPRLR
jgi:hypothetical protein